MINEYLIYWIHNGDETDIYTQGYVGITNNLPRRLIEHKKHKNAILIDRTVDIFLQGDKEYCKSVEKELRPKKYIGLNVAAGGGMPPNVTGIKRSDKTKLLMSQNNVGFKGRKHTEATKKKMSESRKGFGKPHTEETKKKLSEIAKQRKFQPMTGRKHSEKTRQLISEKLKGKKHTHTHKN
jgi:predicted GIY-YIG superfamily endonuclease